MRILVDEEDFAFAKAWEIVTNVFFYTNHTVLPVRIINIIDQIATIDENLLSRKHLRYLSFSVTVGSTL